MRESFFFAASAASANLQHKTDGSHTNRPFFSCLMQDERETSFSQKDILPRYVFCFFSSRKKSSPLLFFLEEKTVSLRGKRSPSDGRLLFFLEEKTVGLRGKRSPSDGRTQAHPALSSVGIPQRVCLPPPPCLCPCPPRLRVSFPVQTDHAKENQLRSSFPSVLLPFSPTRCTKRTVHIRTVRLFCSGQGVQESIYSQINQLPRSVFCFFSSRKEIVPLLFFLEEKKSFPCRRKENAPL